MRTLMIVVAVVLIAVMGIGLYYVRLMADMGSFSSIEPHFDGTCETMDGFAGGTDDLLIDRETGWVFVSAFDRRTALANPDADVRGAIQAFRLGAPEEGAIDITPQTPADFRPHGISFYSGQEGKRLFVISHRADGTQAIELFDVLYDLDGTPSLGFVETITDPLIISPNDLVAVGPRAFYVGNDSTTADHESLSYMLELYLRQNRTTLVYYDGAEATVAARGLTYANGVEVSPDGRTLYLAETTDGTLRVYDRDPASGLLTQRAGPNGLLKLGPGLDNIDIDGQGRVWITAHPQPFKLQGHREEAANLSPSQVNMITPDMDGGGSVAEVYLGDGHLASGSSVTAYHDETMVIGVIFEPHVVICNPTHEHIIGN
jgi:arylesterase/paraoxonase